METVFRKYFTARNSRQSELNVAKPKWLKVKLPIGQKYTELRGLEI
jgi:lipoic acid synthetase